MTAPDPFIRVEDVVFQYSADLPPALRGVSLTIAPGEFVALIGQNGSGKTTLAKHLNGLLKPSRGRVLVQGVDTRRANLTTLARTVGYCYQNPDHQIFASTVAQEVAFGPSNLGLPPAEVRARVDEALALVGLTEHASAFPFILGKGRRQQLAVASILAMKPAVLVVDEPTTGMDWRGSRAIMDLLTRLNQAGHTIVVITHELHIVARYARRAVVLTQGRIVADAAPRDVLRNVEVLRQASLRPLQATRIAQHLQARGVAVDALDVDDLTALVEAACTVS